jgi:hypothetical protein
MFLISRRYDDAIPEEVTMSEGRILVGFPPKQKRLARQVAEFAAQHELTKAAAVRFLLREALDRREKEAGARESA